MKRLIIGVILAVALVIVPASGVLAAQDTVTVTATPSYIAIVNAPDTWTLNGIDGNSVIEPNTKYYANPTGATGDITPPSATVLDTECYFTITNTSSVITDVKIDIENFTGGSDPMTNSELGTNGAGVFGAYSWCEGMTYTNKVIAKLTATGSAPMKEDLAATTALDWGMEVLVQSDAWAGGTSSTSTITITVTAA